MNESKVKGLELILVKHRGQVLHFSLKLNYKLTL